MNPGSVALTIVLTLLGIGVLVAIFVFTTPMGKRALESMRNTGGAKAEQLARSMETPQTQLTAAEAQAEEEGKKRLAIILEGRSTASGIIKAYDAKKATLELHKKNYNGAVARGDELSTDGIPDEQQGPDFAAAETVFTSSKLQMDSLQAELDDPQYQAQVEEARQMLREADILIAQLPAEQAALIKRGQLAAARTQLSNSKTLINLGRTPLGGKSKAAETIERMEQQAMKAQSDAEGSAVAAAASPRSAEANAAILASTHAARSGDFRAAIKAYNQEKAQA